jgi:CRP-like cAMP-binding protein
MSPRPALYRSSHPTQNGLLAALPPRDFARVAPHLIEVAMPLGEMLYEPGSPMHVAYFPTTAVVSLHYVLESGDSAETAAVGYEGVVGASLLVGGLTAYSSAAVQIAGRGYRLAGPFLRQEFERAEAMHRLALKYMQALMVQSTQIAVCNRHHAVEQQICRWLLSTLDRLRTNEIVVTQEMIAVALGVRRESVSEAAATLQRAGVIRCLRGRIRVLDRSELERDVCECYGVVRHEMGRLLSRSSSWSPHSFIGKLRVDHVFAEHAT